MRPRCCRRPRTCAASSPRARTSLHTAAARHSGRRLRPAFWLAGATTEVLVDHTVSVVALTLSGRSPAEAAARLIARLRERDPRIWAGEDLIDEGRVALSVQHLRDEEVGIVIERLREALAG